MRGAPPSLSSHSTESVLIKSYARRWMHMGRAVPVGVGVRPAMTAICFVAWGLLWSIANRCPLPSRDPSAPFRTLRLGAPRHGTIRPRCGREAGDSPRMRSL